MVDSATAVATSGDWLLEVGIYLEYLTLQLLKDLFRILLESNCYDPKDAKNCFEILVPSLNKYISMLPTSLQQKIKDLKEEVDEFTGTLSETISDDQEVSWSLQIWFSVA